MEAFSKIEKNNYSVMKNIETTSKEASRCIIKDYLCQFVESCHHQYYLLFQYNYQILGEVISGILYYNEQMKL
jgi:hypothetical protein